MRDPEAQEKASVVRAGLLRRHVMYNSLKAYGCDSYGDVGRAGGGDDMDEQMPNCIR
jgi:hypothetical protein